MMTNSIRSVLAATGFVFLLGCGGPEYPTSVELTVRPGAVIAVPFDQPVEGAPKRALSYVPAAPILNPKPLPQELALVHSSLALFSSGDVSGDVLLHVPETAAGEIELTLAAAGDGRGIAASMVGFRTRALNVKITVDGAAVSEASPEFAGIWRQDDKIWTFSDGLSPILEIDYPSGEQMRMLYEIYPDGQGRWLLIEPGPEGDAFWVEFEGPDILAVSHSGETFRPFARLTRQ